MTNVDLIRGTEDEPFISIPAERTPAVGDRILIEEEPLGRHRRYEVIRREWFIMAHRPKPLQVATLYVLEISEEQ